MWGFAFELMPIGYHITGLSSHIGKLYEINSILCRTAAQNAPSCRMNPQMIGPI
jgi:hypothetical protein